MPAESFSAPVHTLEIESYYDMWDREKWNKLFKRYPKTNTLSWLQAMPNRMIETNQIKFYHYEENQWLDAAVKFASATTTAGVCRAVIAADSHRTIGGVKKTYPRVLDLIQFDDFKTGIIVAKNAAADPQTIDIVPIETGVAVADLTATITNSVNKIGVCYSEAEPEDGDMTETIMPSMDKFSGVVQTFREDYKVTGHADKVDVEIEVTPGNKKLYIKGLEDATERFKMKEELGLLVTPLAGTDGKITVAGKETYITYALIPKMKAQGINNGYNASSLNAAGDGFKFSYWTGIIKKLEKAYGDHEYFVEMGINFDLLTVGMLKDFGSEQNTVNFSSFSGGKEQALSLNFRSIGISGYSFHLHRMEILSHANSLGADGFTYPDMGLFLPGGLRKDPEDGESKPAIAVRYFKQTGGGSKGHYLVAETGLNARIPTGTKHNRVITQLSQKGLQMMGIEKFLFSPKTA